MKFCKNCGIESLSTFCSTDCEAQYYYENEPDDPADIDAELAWRE
jgi:hypothetical protein